MAFYKTNYFLQMDQNLVYLDFRGIYWIVLSFESFNSLFNLKSKYKKIFAINWLND